MPPSTASPLVASGKVSVRGNPPGRADRGPSRVRHAILPALVVLVLPALAACRGSGSPEGAEAAAAEPPVATAQPASAVQATADPVTTTAAPATTPPTTAAPVTEPPTTAAPTSTAPPPPPLPPGPWNVEPIGAVSPPLAAVGERSGAETTRVQQRLLDLGFWLTAPDGRYGLTTRQAVMAVQKYAGLPASGSVDQATADYLTNSSEQARATADAGTMVEVDKHRQLLFFVVDGKTQWVFNTSTGNGKEYEEEDQNSPGEIVKGVALTPDGLHRVYRERPEGWWEGDLGKIYRPKYFSGGAAVHGSNSVPNYPASHGCVRVTTEAMDFIWNTGMMPMNIPVWVHGDEPV